MKHVMLFGLLILGACRTPASFVERSLSKCDPPMKIVWSAKNASLPNHLCREGHYDASACNDTKVGEACKVVFTSGGETDSLCVVRRGEWDFFGSEDCRDIHDVPYTLHIPSH